MHNVITNAWRGDPYKLDTLLIFMANMAWNSSMNTSDVRDMLKDKDENGEYKIPVPRGVRCVPSEMTAFADLILPDTTYLERYDAMSMLDRPISEYDGPVDSVRIPILPVTGDCKPFAEVLIELGSRMKFPPSPTRMASANTATTRISLPILKPPQVSHSLLERLAWAEWSKIHAWRTQPESVRTVRQEQLYAPPRLAEILPVHA